MIYIYCYVSLLVAVVERFVDIVAPTKPKPKFIVEDVKPAVTLEIKPPQSPVVDDDWFVLLDVAEKLPGILLLLWED